MGGSLLYLKKINYSGSAYQVDEGFIVYKKLTMSKYESLMIYRKTLSSVKV